MDKTKPFGLVLPKRAQAFRPKNSAIFDPDSDDEPSKKKICSTKIPQAKPKKISEAEKCLDPSIYEYDSIYDDMKAQEVAKSAPKDKNKPSRYIDSLLKAADKRKKQHERRVEKKVHNEREKEGDKFKDKEAFVTSAYKKKMQEMEEEEERERRENQMNEMMDVTKQKDLSGFYRHFLKQSVGEEKIPVFGERHSIKQETQTKSEDIEETNKLPTPSTSDVRIKEEKLSDSDNVSPKDNVVDDNIDQDSDIVSSSDDEAPMNEKEKNSSSDQIASHKDVENNISSKNLKPVEPSLRNIRKRTEDDDSKSADESHSPSENDDDHSDSQVIDSSIDNHPKEAIEKDRINAESKISRRDIFAKRTVGEVFTSAQARYFQRMAARSA